jgi:hypothetical protein
MCYDTANKILKESFETQEAGNGQDSSGSGMRIKVGPCGHGNEHSWFHKLRRKTSLCKI